MVVESGTLNFGAARDGDACLMRSADDHFSGVYSSADAFADGFVSAAVLSEGSVRRDYGLVLRVQAWDGDIRFNPRDGYRCKVKTGGDGAANSVVTAEALEAGRRSTLATSSTFALDVENWYAVKATAVGDTIACEVRDAAGNLLGETTATDARYAAGHWGTWNYLDDSGAHYWKDLFVKETPSSGAAAAKPPARRLRGAE